MAIEFFYFPGAGPENKESISKLIKEEAPHPIPDLCRLFIK